MRCRDAMERIGRKREGSLPATLARELERHLSACPRCRAESLLQARMDEALRAPPPDRLRGDFTDRVVRRTFAHEPARERSSRWRDLAPVLALAAAAIWLFVLVPDLLRLAGAGESSGWWDPIARPFLSFAESLGGFFGCFGGLFRVLDGSRAAVLRSAALGLVSVGAAAWAFRQVLGYMDR
ncbi:MAG: zf-HC2 domain-containing protein [Candidatus Eisenbacteria bacterium]